MSELLLIYATYALATGVTAAGGGRTGSLPAFMPLRENDVLWTCVGFAGIATFGTRFLVQWVYSERHRESRVPPVFWWQSLVGTVLCLAYFLRQQDSVGVAGYLLNVIPYARNLVLVYRKKREEREERERAIPSFPVVRKRSFGVPQDDGYCDKRTDPPGT